MRRVHIVRMILLYVLLNVLSAPMLSAKETEVNGLAMEHGIYSIGEHNWEKFRTKQPISLINYMIPWCKHCKTFAPIFDQLAEKIERTLPQVAVGKVLLMCIINPLVLNISLCLGAK